MALCNGRCANSHHKQTAVISLLPSYQHSKCAPDDRMMQGKDVIEATAHAPARGPPHPATQRGLHLWIWGLQHQLIPPSVVTSARCFQATAKSRDGSTLQCRGRSHTAATATALSSHRLIRARRSRRNPPLQDRRRPFTQIEPRSGCTATSAADASAEDQSGP